MPLFLPFIYWKIRTCTCYFRNFGANFGKIIEKTLKRFVLFVFLLNLHQITPFQHIDMKGFKSLFIFVCLLTVFSTKAQERRNVTVRLETTYGDIRIRLFDDTPGHRDNFIKNVEEGMYDGVMFHRIIRNFMIQTGNPDTREGDFEKVEPDDTTQMGPSIPAEIRIPEHYHLRGMVAAAREGDEINPLKESSKYQFYIVTGKHMDRANMAIYEQERREVAIDLLFNKKVAEHAAELSQFYTDRNPSGAVKMRERLYDEAKEEMEALYKPFFTDEMRRQYVYNGGTPWLDGDYTVFGEVIDGMKTVLKIEKVKTDADDAPKEEVRILKAVVE